MTMTAQEILCRMSETGTGAIFGCDFGGASVTARTQLNSLTTSSLFEAMGAKLYSPEGPSGMGGPAFKV